MSPPREPIPEGRRALREGGFASAVALGYLVCALLFGVLLALEWRSIDRSVLALARERGATLFALVETTREWNARHGGVYVLVSDEGQPNPYLEHPARDIDSADGRRLTMVNPAYMTRQIAELAEAKQGVRVRITSLSPIRPGNAPDPWEREALRRFERGEAEVLELVAAGDTQTHRYMAPLLVVPACLQCHGNQGYEVGDVRGGISVTMPAQALIAMRDTQRLRTGAMHLLAFLISAGLIHGLLLVNRRHLRVVRAINADQERLIALRTGELADANRKLADEVDLHRHSARQLAESEARYRAVFDGAAEGIIVTDAESRITQVNPAFCRITGYAAAEVLGRTPALLASGRHDADYFAQMYDSLAREGNWQGEMWNRRKSGDLYVQWISIVRVGAADDIQGYIAPLSDIPSRKALEDKIRYRADHDPLTGLPNRALFDDRLASALAGAHRRGSAFALLFVDLDRFKAVNDRLGHLAGDALLVEAGERLNACVRESDTVARLGGDEFAVILNEIGGMDDVEEIALRIGEAIATPFVLEKGEGCVSASIGIVLAPEHGGDAQSLLRRADLALYAVKHGGRGHHRFYTPALGD